MTTSLDELPRRVLDEDESLSDSAVNLIVYGKKHKVSVTYGSPPG